MKKHNLHIHSRFSDGALPINAIAREAESLGMEAIGTADHAFTTKLVKEYTVQDLDEYISAIRDAQTQTSMKLFAGLEIDSSRNTGYKEAELPYDQLNRLDYVLFEYVSLPGSTFKDFRPLTEITSIRDKLTVPVGLAHMDLALFIMNSGDEDILENTAKYLSDNDIFLEINQSEIDYGDSVYTQNAQANGRNTRNGRDFYLHFSSELISALVKYNVKCVIGTDAHHRYGIGNVDGAMEFVTKNNLLLHEIVR